MGQITQTLAGLQDILDLVDERFSLLSSMTASYTTGNASDLTANTTFRLTYAAVLPNVLVEDDKGAVLGVASLDSNGYLTSSQIPPALSAGLTPISTYDASGSDALEESPATGDFYRVNVAGTSSIMDGSTDVDFSVGDWIVYNGTTWERWIFSVSAATTGSLGEIMLSGDLGGTATAPAVESLGGVPIAHALPAYGDVKDSYQTADHSGWILADGRLVSTLTTEQQAVALALGWTTSIPDLTDRYRMGAGGARAVGDTFGSAVLALSNLPNVTFESDDATFTPSGTVTINSSGSHSHGMRTETGGGVTSSGTDVVVDNNDGPGGTYSSYNTSSSGSHTHTATFAGAEVTVNMPDIYLNGNVTQTEFYPPSVALNAFVYLGA